MESKQADLQAVLAGTPFAVLIQSIISGEFAAPPDREVDENETVIGELSILEKAIFTTKGNLVAECNAFAEIHNAMAKEAILAGGEDSIARIKESSTKYDALKDQYKAFNSLFWTSIRERLGSLVIGNIGIRAGYQIAVAPLSEDEDGAMLLLDARSPLSSLLAGLTGLMGTGDLGDFPHDCGSCPGYDTCDLPIKKLR